MTVKRYNVYKKQKKRVDAVLNVDTRIAIRNLKALKRALKEIDYSEFEKILTLIQGLQRLEMTGFLGHVCPEEPAEVCFEKAHGKKPYNLKDDEAAIDPTQPANEDERLFDIANRLEKAKKGDEARINNYARIIRKDYKWTAPEALGAKIRARLEDFMILSRGEE